MYHSLTDLAGGIGFAPQLMQNARRPQRNSDGEGMRQHLRQRQSIAAQSQRALRVAELTQRKRPKRAGARARIVARVRVG